MDARAARKAGEFQEWRRQGELRVDRHDLLIYLAHEFIASIVEGRPSFPDVYQSLNWTSAGLCAHESALRNGAVVEVPNFRRR